jgi:hypothetical protein
MSYDDVWGPPVQRRRKAKTSGRKKFPHRYCGARPGPKGKNCKRCAFIEDYQRARESYEIRKEEDCDVDKKVTKGEQRTLFQICAGIPVTLRRWLTGGRSR